MHMTGQDFPNYSSSEGAPSDCSDEAWPSHSMVEEDVGQEVTLLVAHGSHVVGLGPGWPDLVSSPPAGREPARCIHRSCRSDSSTPRPLFPPVVLLTAFGSVVVLVAQGHVRGLSRPSSAHLGYQPVVVFAVAVAVVVLRFHRCSWRLQRGRIRA